MSGGDAVTREAAVARLRGALGEAVSMAPDAIDLDVPITAYGMNSASAMEMLLELEKWAGVRLDPEVFADNPSLSELADDVVLAAAGRAG
jgi:acyl carrier protein